MMATEVASENLVDATPRVDDEQISESTPTDDANANISRVNGESDHYEQKPDHDQNDAVVTSAEVSVSGGSDSEATRPEASKTAGDDKGHLRTLSGVKKPTSFKAVSVNKKFLAAKSATAVAPKLGEKAAPATATPSGSLTSSTPRPRLVAKTGSGLRDSSPRTAGSGTGGKPSTPDASAVWNKNRPVPPPEPKKFTDEELKQQYGIHLATRLQADDPGKQGNWADIDDDDDDWAPETIEWTDGTKITLHATEDLVPPTPEPAPIPVSAKELLPVDPPKSRSPAPVSTASPKLKLGGTAAPGKGLVLKGAPEKPTLVAKPPGPPAPIKSPWAPLPPVEKVPVTVETTSQFQQARFTQRDPHGFDGIPPMPAKEIAADDFSRTWRDGNQHPRELYNSHSGRYEPVHDGRRGSRGGPTFLQRGPNDQAGPAEPSAAFQTHRTSTQDGPWQRRRTSSNVSGGSGAFGRRASRGAQDMPPAHDSLNARRGSLTGFSDSPSSPSTQPARALSNQPWQRSPAISHASPGSVHSQAAPHAGQPPIPPAQATTPGANIEDELELQKKFMREKIEEAKRRRQEQEAMEEAAKQERIRLKLQALGPAPESNRARKETQAKEEKEKSTTTGQEAMANTIIPPKPPVPENAGETRQYGMMKVHHPESVKVLTTDARAAEAKAVENKSETTVNGAHPSPPKDTSTPMEQTQEDRPKSWQQSSPAERFTGWGPPPSSSSGVNVWGPPTNNRSLGNGTFNPELSRLPDMRGNEGPRGPGPIGPPGPNSAGGQYPSRGRESYVARPGPIAPPHRQEGQRPQINNAWQNNNEKISQSDAEHRKQLEEDATKMRELRAAGQLPQTTFRETFHEVKVDSQGYRTEPQRTEHIADGERPVANWDGLGSRPGQPEPTRSVDAEPTSHRGFQDPWRSIQADNNHGNAIRAANLSNPPASSTTSSPPIRQSKWFPVRDVRLEEQANAQSITRPSSPSPPPPTMAGHPAYDGDITHPHVSLPRPSPIVRLPPAPVLPPIGPPRASGFHTQNPTASTSAVGAVLPRQDPRGRSGHMEPHPVQSQTAGGWQDRINHLIGRKSPGDALTSAGRSHTYVPVSLPKATVFNDADDSVTSRSMAEECFEEQEMGSLPAVRVPHKVSDAAWHPAPATKSFPKKFAIWQPATYDSDSFTTGVLDNGNFLVIFLPGMGESKKISLPEKAERRQKSNPRRGGDRPRGSSRHASTTHPRGGRAPSAEHGHMSPGGRGGHRGRGLNSPWANRHVSTPAAAV